MKCKDCEYYINFLNVKYCESKNYKRNIVRISKEEAERDINCKWAHKEKKK